MRGTHAFNPSGKDSGGIIPAYAGNTAAVKLAQLDDGDHPRVCGEHTLSGIAERTGLGSSPRMRGTRVAQCDDRAGGGIIPAYAGNTSLVILVCTAPRDHPRVCGEHTKRL